MNEGGGPAIGPSLKLILYVKIRYKVLFKNLTPKYIQTSFANGHVVYDQIERASNVIYEEEIMNIPAIFSYLIYYGFGKYLDVAMVYERLLYSIETSVMHSHKMIFLCSCMVLKWRLDYVKTFLQQAQIFEMLPLDARQWLHSRFSQLLPRQNMGMAGQKVPTPTATQQYPLIQPYITPPKINTAGIPVFQIDASLIQALL